MVLGVWIVFCYWVVDIGVGIGMEDIEVVGGF